VVLLGLVLAFPRMNFPRDGSGITSSAGVQRVSQAAGKTLDRAALIVGSRPEPTATKATTNRTASTSSRPKSQANKSTPKSSGVLPKPDTKTKATAAGAKRPKARRILSERTVAEGDYLRRIAARYYGDEMLWPLVWQYNKQRAKQVGQDLENPDLIYPGWKLYIPKKEKSEE
ncbi:MAG: LysM peptidoglycan-binding domain-containing protein, partial [Chloroflexota bacterium]|nr:LysM peptidoglycan-binding domain-containing protein [Chloroflexota bacterium]